MEFRPAEVNTGVVFVRDDLRPAVRIPVNVKRRVEAPRRTNLAVGDASVEMVEHVLAALAGLRIDNCEVRVDQPEIPGCDGSSLAFVEALQDAQIVEQPVPRPLLRVQGAIRVGDERAWVEATAVDHDDCEVHYELNYEAHRAIGRQAFGMRVSPARFCRELAPARTFLLQREADWLRSQGLGNRVTTSDLLVFAEQGPIDNPLRFEDECVRHKTLDMVGDLALLGCDLIGRVTAFRSGHRLNAELVRALVRQGLTREGLTNDSLANDASVGGGEAIVGGGEAIVGGGEEGVWSDQRRRCA